MSLALIELNDAEITVSIDGDLVSRHPGTAVMLPQNLITGQQAHKQARLQPRLRKNQFWDQLSTEPMPDATALIRHHADLAFKQLEALWNEVSHRADGIIIALPSSFSKEDLGLILGMCQAGQIPVRSMVDLALLTASSVPIHNTAFYLDISLHRTVLTEIRAGVALTRGESHALSDSGLFRIMERCANALADQFIQTNRFDPLHEANTEQVLFDQLEGWLNNPNRNTEQLINVQMQQTSYSCAATLEQLSTACSDLYPTLIQGIRNLSQGNRQLLVSHRMMRVPGLAASLALLPETEIIYLDETASRSSFVAIEEEIFRDQDKVSFVTTLPVQRQQIKRPEGTDAVPADKSDQATHMLSGYVAYSLVKSLPQLKKLLGTQINLEVTDQGDARLTPVQGTAVRLNKQPLITSSILNPGDIVETNGQTYILITVQ